MKKLLFTFFVICLSLARSQAQGFINLNFESANVSGYSPGSDIPTTDAVPGWSVYYDSPTYGTSQETQIVYDGISTGGALVSLVDTNVGYSSFNPIAGEFSVFLFGGGSFNSDAMTISQTGVVPVGTESLTFDALVYGASFSVSLGGQTISAIPLETFSNYTLYGANIPAGLAGELETLSFTMPPPANSPPSMFELDNIQFLSTSVPEPSVLGLYVLGGIFLAWRYQHKFSRNKA